MIAQSLKSGWKMVKFGEVVKNANLVERDPEANDIERIVGLEHIDPENLHILRWNSVADGTSFSRKFVPGQTLFGKRRAYQRKVAYAEFEGICSGDILTFEPKNRKVLLPELLPFICQSDAFFDHALDTSAGSLSPRTSWTALKDFEVPLPPLDEQKRIAEILWATSLEQEAKNIALEANRSFLLCKLSEISRFLNPKDRTYSWEESKLGTIFKHKKDKGYSDLPVLSVTIEGKIVPRNSLNRNVEDRTGPEKCFRVDPGDIAYNTMRMWQGACALSTDSGIISPAYTVISIKSKEQLPEFWIRVFRTPWMKKTFERFSTGVASDRWRLYYRDFSAIKIKRPPLTYQQNVLDELFAAELAVKSAEVSVQNSLGLQKALIQKYLTGATIV